MNLICTFLFSKMAVWRISDLTWTCQCDSFEGKRIHWNTMFVILCKLHLSFLFSLRLLTFLPVHLFQSPSTSLSSCLFLFHAHPQHPFSSSRSRIIHRQIFIYSSNWIATVARCIVFCSIKEQRTASKLLKKAALSSSWFPHCQKGQQLLIITLSFKQYRVFPLSLRSYYRAFVLCIQWTNWKHNREVCRDVSSYWLLDELWLNLVRGVYACNWSL